MNHKILSSDLEIIKSCNICKSKKFKIISNVFFKNKLNFFQSKICLNCNYVFRSIRPKIQWFKKNWNSRFSFQQKNKVTYINPKIEQFRISRYKKIFDFLKKKNILKKKNKIIDIGCGTGSGLKQFSKLFNIYGLEADNSRGSIAKKNGIKVFDKSIENFNSKIKFDIVLCIQTLEHFHEPQDAINKINKICKDLGYVYIEVPNIKHYVLSWHDSIYLAHLSTFAAENLKMLLVKNSLTPILETYPQTDNGEINLGILARKNDKGFKIKKLSLKDKLTQKKRILKSYSIRKNKVFFNKFPININVNLINDISLMVKPIKKIFKNVLKNIFIRDLKFNKNIQKYEITQNDFKNEKIPNRKILRTMKYIPIKNKIKVY